MLGAVTLTGIERTRHRGASAPAAAGPRAATTRVTTTSATTTTRAPTTSELGLLDGRRGRPYTLLRWAPPADLADRVERLWLVAWDLPEHHAAQARLIPHPCVNLVVDERGRAAVSGCGREVFAYPLHGRGAVVGVKIRAGAFRAFLGADVAGLTGRTLPASALWTSPAWAEGPHGTSATERAAVRLLPSVAEDLAGADDDPRVPPAARELGGVLLDGLRELAPPPLDPGGPEDVAGRAVHALLTDPRVRRVSDVAAGMSPRALQRLFRAHVGVTAQEVLRRGRMHLVAERIDATVTAGAPPDWARLAADLGFADQPHFIREFRAVLGTTPSAYAASLAEAATTPAPGPGPGPGLTSR